MHTGNQITIVQVQNGWVVTLPFVMQAYADIHAQARIVKKEFHGEDEALAELTRPPAPKVSDLKEENIYIFYTFQEMINFIAMQTAGMIIDKFHAYERD